MPRRRVDEEWVLRTLRADSGAAAEAVARALFKFARDQNLVMRGRQSAVSVRIPLGPESRPGTLFVLPGSDRFYTYWLDHWPSRYRGVAKRYAKQLQRLFPGKRVIAPHATRRDVVRMSDVAQRLGALERVLTNAVASVRSVNAESMGTAPESLVGLEGEERRRMVVHRKREGRLRDARIAFVRRTTGALECEVSGCGFDFSRIYGSLGDDYAQVHHTRPLAGRAKPSETRVEDLRVVCANCHVMIHRGGKSRSLREIARALATGGRQLRPGAA